MKCFSTPRFERFMADRASVIDTSNKSFSLNLEVDGIVRIRHSDTIAVNYFHGNKGKITAVGFYFVMIHCEQDSSRLPSRFHFFTCDFFAVLFCNSKQRSGSVRHSPRKMQNIIGLFPYTQRCGIEKQFHLIAAGIGNNINRIALFPIPMRKTRPPSPPNSSNCWKKLACRKV